MRCMHWLWVLLLCLNMGCNGCEQYGITREEDQWGAAVAISSVTPLGRVHGYPVLELRGVISKNVPGIDTPFLCVLMVPDGTTPDEGATAIQSHEVTQGAQDTSSNALSVGKLYSLPGGSFVQYERPLNPGETGTVDFAIASWSSDNSLVLGTTYHIYLGIKVGPHFFYNDSACRDCILPNAATLVQVTMGNVQCAYNRSGGGQVFPQLTADATATNTSVASDQGFLLLKQGVDQTPSAVFAKQLQAGSTPLPTNLNTLTAHLDSGVVIWPVDVNNANNKDSTIRGVADATGVLEKGVTYDVYGYVQVGSNDYYVSQNHGSITLPEVEIEVALVSVGDPSLVAQKDVVGGGDYNVSEFTLDVSGSIRKMDNATKPVAGFVFVAADLLLPDTATICQTIKDTISNTSSLGSVVDVNNNKDYVVCVAATAVAVRGDIQHTCTLTNGTSSYLALNRGYRVYFWVKDAQGNGELFLSANSATLQAFYADGDGITGVGSSHAGNELTIKPHVHIPTLRNEGGAEMGVIFSASNAVPTDAALKALRDRYAPVDPLVVAPSLQIGWNSLSSFPFSRHNDFYLFSDVNTGEQRIGASNDVDLEQDVSYLLSLVVLKGRVLYCIPGCNNYDTPESVTYTRQNPVKTLQSGEEIELDLSLYKAYRIHTGGTSLLNPAKGERVSKKIREAINLHYSEDAQRREAYTNFSVTEE
jgi:hypothetical protein